VKERFLFGWVGVERGDVSVRDEQFAVAIKTHLANAARAVIDGASVRACKTSNAIFIELFIQRALARHRIERSRNRHIASDG
jgi:hypothetical protein